MAAQEDECDAGSGRRGGEGWEGEEESSTQGRRRVAAREDECGVGSEGGRGEGRCRGGGGEQRVAAMAGDIRKGGRRRTRMPFRVWVMAKRKGNPLNNPEITKYKECDEKCGI